MQIFGPDRSAPSVGFSWFCVKPNLKVNTPCVNQKISAHTWHPTKQPISKPSLISNLSLLSILNFVPRETGKLFTFYRTHLLRTCKQIGIPFYVGVATPTYCFWDQHYLSASGRVRFLPRPIHPERLCLGRPKRQNLVPINMLWFEQLRAAACYY